MKWLLILLISDGDVVISKGVAKQVKLAQQCIERVSVLSEKIGKILLTMTMDNIVFSLILVFKLAQKCIVCPL